MNKPFRQDDERRFPDLPDSAQEIAVEVAELGLSLTYYNSGTSRHQDNGFKVWRGLVDDHFADRLGGAPLIHRRTLTGIREFLAGVRFGRGE